MKTNSPLRARLLASLLILPPSSFLLAQGTLTPPGAPAPTMKTLDQLEPRTPISALPFTIGASGSYYLTGNLTAAAGGAGIIINASSVTLDLGGFVLAGNGGAALKGVSITGSASSVTIRNGTVRAWTGDGIAVASAASNTDLRVENVRALGNGARGIALGDGGVATACTARGNAADGITGGTGCQVLGCTAADQTGAGADGVTLGADSLVLNCTASGNAGDGFNVGNGGVLSGCAARGNGDDGIVVALGGAVRGCTSRANADAGIELGSGASASECTVESNTGAAAISALSSVALFRCTARGNTSSAATSQSILVGAYSSVTECTVISSGSTAAVPTASTGMGIAAGTGCLIERCSVAISKGDGIRASASCRIVGNLVSLTANSPGADGAGVHTTDVGNHIDGNSISVAVRGIHVDSTDGTIVRNRVRAATNYVIAANNNLGPIVVPGNNAVINGSGAVASSLGTTDPWANLSD